MPFPCSAPSNSDLPGLPVSNVSLQTTGAASISGGNPAADGSQATFDNVLSGLNDASSAASDKDDSSEPAAAQPSAGDAPATTDQLAMIATFLMPNVVPLPAAAPVPTAPTSEDQPSLTLLGAEGRSVPELLARGAETLEYNVTAKLGTSPQSAMTAAQLPTGSAVEPISFKEAKDAPVLPAAATVTAPLPSSGATPAASAPPAIASSAPATLPAASSASIRTTAIASGTPGVPLPASDSQAPAISAASVPASAATDSAAAAAAAPDSTSTVTDVANVGRLQANAVATAGGQSVAPLKGGAKSRADEALEKTAGSNPSQGRSGGYSSAARGKNLSLTVDAKGLKEDLENVGTAAANWGKTMYQDLRTFADAANHANSGAGAGLTGIGAATTRETAPATAVIPSHAGELVHEIREIADGLWAVERNSVEVKFNFGEQDKLSVRVEYRDGTVSTTFRTDSADLRDAIAREWQSQTAASDQRPYRMADPVFSTPTTPSGFSMGGDASRQQQRSSEQPAPAERFFPGAAPRSGAGMTTSSVVSPTSRPETAGRLHAIA